MIEDCFRIGVVTTTHGIRGEVKVFPTTDDPKRFEDCDEVFLVKKNETLTLHVESVKYFKKLVILKFKEFNNINDVEDFRQCDILVSRENALVLKEGEFFLYDAIGLEVFDEADEKIGQVRDVIETGANNVLVVDTINYGEVLFPIIDECIKKVDIDNKKIIAHIMKGLV